MSIPTQAFLRHDDIKFITERFNPSMASRRSREAAILEESTRLTATNASARRLRVFMQSMNDWRNQLDVLSSIEEGGSPPPRSR